MVLALMSTLSCAVADQAPRAEWSPSVPPGLNKPSGYGAGKAPADFPPFEFDPEAPQISAINDSVGPGDTLVLTGENLRGATLNIWFDGERVTVEPLRSDDQRMIAVMPETVGGPTTWVWPESRGRVGVPIRINTPQVWWVWPCRADPAQDNKLRVFGKHIYSEHVQGLTIAIAKDGEEAQVSSANFDAGYELYAAVPKEPGRYRLWVRDDSGGWSEPVAFDVQSRPVVPDRTVKVDRYLRHGGSARDAITKAIREVQKRGGGVVELGPRTYTLVRPITIPPGPPVHLRGAAQGTWDPKQNKIVGEGATVIRYNAGTPGIAVIDVRARGSQVSDLAVICESPVPRSAIRLTASDLAVRRCLVVRTREDTPISGIHSAYPGEANHQIESCTVFGVSSCIRVGLGSDYVRIAECELRGSFSEGSATASNAVINQGGNQMIMERCRVSGVDRTHGKVLSRTCLLYHSSIRNTYIARNLSTEVGPDPSVKGVDGNTGEQYLFHHRGKTGGRFGVERAGADSVTLLQDLPSHVTAGGDWVVFIDAGPGAGQWRTITGRREANQVLLDRPWRVVPGEGSVAVIQQAFRHNIVFGNVVNAPADPGRGMKLVGVYFFQNAFENIVASNHLNNVAVGVAIACDANMPSAWNLVTRNTIKRSPEGGNAYAGGSAQMPMFLNEHARGLSTSQRRGIEGWVGLGNVFRSNTCTNAPAAASVGWLRGSQQDSAGYRVEPSRGIVMSVIEHNTFEEAGRGVLLSSPANWSVIRGNTFTGESAGQPVRSHHRAVLDPLIEEAP